METKLSPFIAIEGMDGAGKTTLVRRLRESLLSLSDHQYVFIREPGGDPFGEALREIFLDPRFQDESPQTKMLLLFTGRNSNIEKIVIPHRRKGNVVISDRFDGSTLAYQVFAEPKTTREQKKLTDLFWTLRENVVLHESIPTLYLYLDLPPKIAYARRAADTSQNKNHYDEKPLDFYEREYAGYENFFMEIRKKGTSKVAIIDATQSHDEVFEASLRVIREHIRFHRP